MRRTGYLANLINLPPLIFKFQFNPEILSEKKSFNYRESNSFGKWEFDRAKEGSGAMSGIFGALDDLKEFGSLLVATKPLESESGGQRTFALDFALDASARGEPPPPQEGGTQLETLLDATDARVGDRIEPSLAVLRSFMNPTWDPVEILGALTTGRSFCPLVRPPICTLKLGEIDLDCVMTDLNIKVTQFKADLSPLRAEVSLTLKEQTFSISTSLDYLARQIEVMKSYAQLNGDDWVQTLPAAGLIQSVFQF